MKHWLGASYLRLIGWTSSGTLPDAPKLIAILAPHTSSWDFPIGLAFSWTLNRPIGFVGKAELFDAWFGGLFRWLQGVPIYRNSGQNMVEQLVDSYNEVDELAICLAPEGTRQRTEYWRSGFYHVARLVSMPLVPVSIDYVRRTIEIGEAMTPTDDPTEALKALEHFFKDANARYPEWVGPVRFRLSTP